MSVTRDIFRTYRHPETVLRHRIGPVVNEGGALVTLMLACLLIFVGNWPQAIRAALADGQEVQAYLAAALFAWIFVMPLVLYVFSAIVAIVQKILRGKASGYEVRMAIYWGLLAATPLWMLYGLIAGLAGREAGITSLIGGFALAALLFFWAIGLNEVIRGPKEDAADV